MDVMETVDKIRSLFSTPESDALPNDLNTDLNLGRWAKGWKGDLDEIRPRLKAYVENRKAARLDAPDLMDTYRRRPIVEEYLKFFSVSQPMINVKDNSVFIVLRLENVDLNKLLNNVMTCGDFLSFYFVLMESLFRFVLKQEATSGRQSGISLLYDMHGFNVADCANANGPLIKICKLIFAMLQDYYCEVLSQVYIVNAPFVFTFIWELVKRCFSFSTRKKFVILGSSYKDQLVNYFDPTVLPRFYGGRNSSDPNSGFDSDTCCNTPATISPKDFRKYEILHEISTYSVEYIKPNQNFRLNIDLKNIGSKLIWKFNVNSDVEFAILKLESNHLVIPRLPCSTPKLSEEGYFICQEIGHYVLEFNNRSTYLFSLKLDYCLKIIE